MEPQMIFIHSIGPFASPKKGHCLQASHFSRVDIIKDHAHADLSRPRKIHKNFDSFFNLGWLTSPYVLDPKKIEEITTFQQRECRNCVTDH